MVSRRTKVGYKEIFNLTQSAILIIKADAPSYTILDDSS